MIACTQCGGDTTVIDRRNNYYDEEIYRRRKCKSCGHELYTIEREIQPSEQFMKRWREHYRRKTKKKKESNDG